MSDTPIVNQKELIHQFAADTRPPFNPELFVRDDDKLIEAMKNVILSCQRDKYFTLKVTNFTVVKNYKEIHDILYNYEQQKIDIQRARGNKVNDNPYSFINLNESDIMILIVDYYISVNDGIENPHDTLRVLITLPRLVEKYYYRINGNYCYAMIQIVDGSTYNNTSSRSKYPNVVYKTIFMPTRIYRNISDEVDYDGQSVKCTLYTAKLFSKFNPVMEYIFAKFGLRGGLSFMGLSNVIHLSTQYLNMLDSYCFEKYGVFVTVPKMLFDANPAIQTTVMTIYHRIDTCINPERQPYLAVMMEPKTARKKDKLEGLIADLVEGKYGATILNDMLSDWYWLESLAIRFNSKPTVDKGMSVLDSLESIYDLDSQQTLKLPYEQKKDIYHVLRWLIREFQDLRMKDNVDVSTKKVRREEYLAAKYATKLSRGIYRASDTQKKITVEDIKRYINIEPNWLLKQISKDQLVSFRNDVNDNDAFIALKFSFKGLSGLGEKRGSTVPDAYKYVHPSHLGRIDIDTSSAGDPGMTGLICPMATIENNSFADGDWCEPNSWEDNFQELMKQYIETSRKIDLVKFMDDMGVNNEDANSKLDMLEASMETSKVALEKMKAVDESTELEAADVLEDGTVVIYTK